jgi:hypothetical protein
VACEKPPKKTGHLGGAVLGKIWVWLVVTGTWLDYDFPFSWEKSSNQRVGLPPTIVTTWQLQWNGIE